MQEFFLICFKITAYLSPIFLTAISTSKPVNTAALEFILVIHWRLQFQKLYDRTFGSIGHMQNWFFEIVSNVTCFLPKERESKPFLFLL